MKNRIAGSLVMVALAVALMMAVAQPAGAGAATEKLKAFYTSALQGDGTFQWVYCSQATRVVRPDGSAVESYKCQLTEWIAPPNTPPGMSETDLFGPIVYPEKAMIFNDDTGFFYFSDFIYLTTDPADLCFAEYWRELVTPSGQVNMRANYPPGGCVVAP